MRDYNESLLVSYKGIAYISPVLVEVDGIKFITSASDMEYCVKNGLADNFEMTKITKETIAEYDEYLAEWDNHLCSNVLHCTMIVWPVSDKQDVKKWMEYNLNLDGSERLMVFE